MRLLLVPFEAVRSDLLSDLRTRLDEVLPLAVERASAHLSPDSAYDHERGQYHSTRLLELLLRAQPAAEGDRYLGVIDRDLFIPILTFVFGEAQLEGRAAVFSLTRLRNSFYGLPDDEGLLMDRAHKEALHEIGHTLGLYHCRRPDCVMRASTNAQEVDLKPAAFCRTCRRNL